MPSRRRFLAAGATATVAALAGCSALDGMPDGIRFAFGPPQEPPDSETGRQVVAYADLAPHEQSLVEKGFDGYITCDDVPESANDLSDRIDTPNIYLRYQGDRYGLWLAITDVVVASTTDPPEGDCGWV